MDGLWEDILKVKPEFRDELNIFEKELLSSLPRGNMPVRIYDASRHLIEIGGKRIRPALNILSFDAVNQNGKELGYLLPISIAIEFIHTATIVHDDIIDLSAKRRGAETVNQKWGNDIALLAGDLIFSKAFGLIGTHEIGELTEIISEACMKLAEGEVLENMHTLNLNMTEEVYLEIIERKTASLFEAATRTGAIAGGGTKEEIKALARFGRLIGVGFQMKDDVLDLISGEKTLGKPIAKDIILGKSTFIILHSIKNASQEERKILLKVLNNPECTNDELVEALNIIKDTGSIDYAKKRSSQLIEMAKMELGVLRESSAKKTMEVIADYAIRRDF